MGVYVQTENTTAFAFTYTHYGTVADELGINLEYFAKLTHL